MRRRGRPGARGGDGCGGGRSRAQQLGVEGPQGGRGVRAEVFGQVPADVLVRVQRLSRPAGVPQGPDAQGLERLVERVLLAQRGESGQGLRRLPQGEGGTEAGAPGVQSEGFPAGGLRGAVRQVRERGAAPEREGLVEQPGGALGVRGAQGPRALRREALEAVGVHIPGGAGQPVSARRRDDGLVAERSPGPPDQGLQGGGPVGGRCPVPDLVDEDAGRDRAAGPQREHGQQGPQAGTADGDGGAVGAVGQGGAEDGVAHRAYSP